MGKTHRERLSELIASIKALEQAADRVERVGGMRMYPQQARDMAREHRAEARLLWKKGVRPVPGAEPLSASDTTQKARD